MWKKPPHLSHDLMFDVLPPIVSPSPSFDEPCTVRCDHSADATDRLIHPLSPLPALAGIIDKPEEEVSGLRPSDDHVHAPAAAAKGLRASESPPAVRKRRLICRLISWRKISNYMIEGGSGRKCGSAITCLARPSCFPRVD